MDDSHGRSGQATKITPTIQIYSTAIRILQFTGINETTRRANENSGKRYIMAYLVFGTGNSPQGKALPTEKESKGTGLPYNKLQVDHQHTCDCVSDLCAVHKSASKQRRQTPSRLFLSKTYDVHILRRHFKSAQFIADSLYQAVTTASRSHMPSDVALLRVFSVNTLLCLHEAEEYHGSRKLEVTVTGLQLLMWMNNQLASSRNVKFTDWGAERKCKRKMRAAVAERLECLPPTKANRVRSSAGSLPDFRKWELCRLMPLVGGFSQESPVSPALAFCRCSFLTSFHHHRLSRSRTAIYAVHGKYQTLRARKTRQYLRRANVWPVRRWQHVVEATAVEMALGARAWRCRRKWTREQRRQNRVFTAHFSAMFDTEKFTAEIRKRTPIYDINSKDYRNRLTKATCWSDVGEAMFGNWHEMTSSQQDKKVCTSVSEYSAKRSVAAPLYTRRKQMRRFQGTKNASAKAKLDAVQILQSFGERSKMLWHSPNISEPFSNGATSVKGSLNTPGTQYTRHFRHWNYGESASYCLTSAGNASSCVENVRMDCNCKLSADLLNRRQRGVKQSSAFDTSIHTPPPFISLVRLQQTLPIYCVAHRLKMRMMMMNETGVPATKKRKYIFYDHLLFLAPYIQGNDETAANIPPPQNTYRTESVKEENMDEPETVQERALQSDCRVIDLREKRQERVKKKKSSSRTSICDKI
ncbi:hypothetical protein PR048_019164 [Dryococelus australis]|uniref:Uncharacterized protein n=1 Tax=Dryococelus australis TaxID=614101 RepID=A0ABQ9H2S5_9NEOP|nr:hypothetical protein PR048_019164 [Dryococelus australis]